MRITGGKAARRILKVPKGLDVRPTPDLVKQAVFNSLGPRVVGARVLELFAGTGALSLDCLSRGAASALCVEKSHKHAEFIRGNAVAAGFEPNLEVRTQDVFTTVRQLAEIGRQFDLILADPALWREKRRSPLDLLCPATPRRSEVAEAARARRTVHSRPHQTRHTHPGRAVARSKNTQARRQFDAVFGNCSRGRESALTEKFEPTDVGCYDETSSTAVRIIFLNFPTPSPNAAEIGSTETFLIFFLNCVRFFPATASSILFATTRRDFSRRAGS